MILAGDIGGTKTLLGLFEGASLVLERRYASRDFADFAVLLRAFLGEAGHAGAIDRACFGVAGPVEQGRARVTYLPWQLEARALAQDFAIGRVELVNDFAAAAQGIATLGPADLVTLQEGGAEANGPRVLIGAGTGLGVAGLIREDGGWRVVPGEGGHAGFAPADEEQADLWRFVRGRAGRVSIERVLSGPGLVEIYRFVCARGGSADVPDPLAADNPAAMIGETALAEPASLAAAAVDLFVRIYGAVAGDLALTFMARGGVYLAGGIAPKLLPRLRQGGFLAAFRDKAEHARLMPGFPVRLVVDEKLGLRGAAHLMAAA